jgi:hypothetical protein
MERLGWPPAQGKGTRSGRTKKRSGAADLEIHQGSLNGGAKSAGFGGVVFQGEAKAGKSWRQGGAKGA